MDGELEIRHLSPRFRNQLVQLLDVKDGWKELMSVIPSGKNAHMPKYTTEHIRMVEEATYRLGRSASNILLDEWGTSGQKRPTLKILLQLLVEAELFRAAEFITEKILKCNPPERPQNGPAAAIDVSETTVKELHDAQLQSREENAQVIIFPTEPVRWPFPVTLSLATNIPQVHFEDLRLITDNFSDAPVKKCGRLLGSGAFGMVFLGILPSQVRVAVKKLHPKADQMEQQFRNEIEVLSKYQHPNVVPLVGFSCDGANFCLVYFFMSNGSLQDRLACLDATEPLQWDQRLRIALDTAKGIVHLHTYAEKPLVHRDIKSANVLLDDQMTAKVGDFGLARLGSRAENTRSAAITTTAFGTSAYMAPEAFRGDVSVKLDTFSYGVVLLELLTGLPPYDENREGCDLVTHVEEMCEESSILSLLDAKAGHCSSEVLDSLFQLAQKCLQEKKLRPNMVEVCQQMEAICANEQEV